MSDAVPLESWQLGPWNRWAYQHVRDVVRTTVVSRGDRPVAELEERPAELEVDEIGHTDGLAVIHDGALVLERYGNEMGPATLHLSQSVAKSVLGLLVGALAGRGALDLAAPVSEHVPEIAGSGYAGATVQHLVDMTAAVDFVEDYANFVAYDIACGWHPAEADAGGTSILEYLPTIGPAARRHGEALHYASPNTDLLGIVAERAGGAPLAELIGRELWAPMGAGHDAELAVDPAGTGVISGGFCATLRDYARLGSLVLGEGRAGERQVVPQAWVARLGAGDETAFEHRTAPDAGAGADGYAQQWWRRDGAAVAMGIHGQLVAVDREARIVVAVLSSWPAAYEPVLAPAQRALVAELRDRLDTG